MGQVYQYNLVPRDPMDYKRYCWNKLTNLYDPSGYDESGTRASFGYGRSIFVINGYVEEDTPVFSYRIDKKAFWLEQTKLTLDLTPGASSACFVNAFNDPVNPKDVEDLKLIIRGQIIDYSGDTFYAIAKCVDDVFTGHVLIKIKVRDDLLLDNEIQATLTALTFDPQLLIDSEEIIDSLGIYDGILYFMGKGPAESTWRNLWSVTLDGTHAVAMQVLPSTNFFGKQSFITIGRYCYVTGGFHSGSIPVWVIDLKEKTVIVVDYSSALIKMPVPLFNPVMTNKANQILILGPSPNPDLCGQVVRLNTATMETSGQEELTLGKKRRTVAAPIYSRRNISLGEIESLTEYSGTEDAVYRFDIIGNGQCEIRNGDIFLGVFDYEGGAIIDIDLIKFKVIGAFDAGDIIRIQCGTSVDQITANNGIADGIFHYYFDTRRCIMWVANIIDAIPLNTTVQLYDYECKFNGMVLASEKIHSKIDDNKYIVSYK